jgi:hypothetical protein
MKTLQIVTNLLTVLKEVLQKKPTLVQMVCKFYTFFLTQGFTNIFHKIPPLDHIHITFSCPVCQAYCVSTYY